MTTHSNKQKARVFCGAAPLVIVALFAFVFSGCFLLGGLTVSENPPAREEPPAQTEQPKVYSAGDMLNGKTIVWVNNGAGSWKYLAMGTPSEPMPWDLDNSRHISTKSISSKIGDGKENSIFLKHEFESAGTRMRTAKNSAFTYCIDRGGWLPSRDEAEKMAQFTSKDFWTSHYDASSKAFYYSPLQKGLQSEWRDDRDSIVAIPVYYLDAKGNITEP